MCFYCFFVLNLKLVKLSTYYFFNLKFFEMKKYIVPIIFILVLFSCKKEAPLSILNEAENEAKLKNEACFNDKKLPTSEVGFAYVEGEIDGKLFRITEGKDGFTASQNVTDFFYS